MKILLTGASGMVGKNVIEHPGLKTFPLAAPSHKELDLLDYISVEHYIRKHEIDFIIHAAGKVGGIQANINEPVRFLLDNLDMGRNIVWAARQCGIKKLINLGSSCMYPRNAVNPLREETILQGELEPTNEGYALAKITIARLCAYISRESSEYQFKTLIPCNLFGRWDKFDAAHSHMIPAVIRKIHDAKMSGSEQVVIWGDGTARREFMYAGDFADCVIQAIHHFDTLPPLMNVGVGFDYSVDEYYRTIADIIGYRGTFEHDLSQPVGMRRKLVDVERQKNWRWKARTSLIDGVKETYNFFLSTYGR
jgi:GDP-L-fucose synthase